MSEAYVLGGVRTPFARYGGTLSHIRTDDLLGMTMKGACERVGVDLDQVEDIVAGCVNPAHEGMGDIARWAALAAGFPDSVAGATINRFCGSSLSATVNVSHAIKAGDLGRRHRLRGGIDVPVRVGADEGRRTVQPAGSGVHARHHVGRRGRPTEPGAVGAQCLHRDDRNRAERRRPIRADPRGDRRVRAALASSTPKPHATPAGLPRRSCR